MRLTFREERKLYAKRDRWAYEELVYDLAMTNHNRISSQGVAGMWQFLKGVCGGRRGALKSIRARLRAASAPCPKVSWKSVVSRNVELRRIRKEEEWVFEEETREIMTNRAIELFATVSGMYRYLLTGYGKEAEVVKMLRWIVNAQRQRRKTLHLGQRA